MGFSELPDASGTDHQRVFESLGWTTRRAGEHIVMTHSNVSGVTLSIPNHRTGQKSHAPLAHPSRRFDR